MTIDNNQPALPPSSSGENRLRRITSRLAARLRLATEYTGSRPFSGLSFRETFAAFQYRNYRLWFGGQLVSLIGTWMQTTAQGFLIYQLTRSPAYLGYVGFAAGLPSWLFMLYGGVMADRVSRRKLLIVTQTAMMILAAILAALTFLEVVQPWHILILALLLGVANAFDAPARQAFVFEMVGRQDLPNAIALNSTMFNLATVVGPAVAGAAYAAVGPAWCFAFNGLSFVAVIVALALMQVQLTSKPVQRAALDDLKEGVQYIRNNIVIRTLIGTAAMMSLFGLAHTTLIPAWAVTVLGGDAATNGWLQSARGGGALIGALTVALLGRWPVKGKLLTVGGFIFPGLLLIFAEMRWLPLALLTMAGVGWGFMVLFNMANTLIQTLVPDNLRGRVVSVYTLSFFGLMPLGALLAGWLAELTSEPLTVVLSALVALAFSAWLWLAVPQLRALP